jgi:arabinogalactan endo-1,4-beta-galactosidase
MRPRSAQLLLFLALHFALALAARESPAQQPADSTFFRCVDLSFLNEVEAAGATFMDDGAGGDALEILQRHGVNTVRLRLWHSPQSGIDGLSDVLAAATRVRSGGMRLLLDLHFSDTWADPSAQTKPAAWQGLDFGALRDSVSAYAERVLRALSAQGTIPDIVQVGNEITGGMLWNDGRVGGAFDTPAQWGQLGELLQSAVSGIKSAVGDTARILIHIDNGGSASTAAWFFGNLSQTNVPFDMIGLSYYPWWHGSLNDLTDTITTTAASFGKPVAVVETAYPWTLQWYDDTNNIIGLPEQLQPGYPASPAGQAAFIGAVVSTAEDVPGGLGSGVCYWAPDYVTTPGLGSPWENLALFDNNGNVLPGARALGGTTSTSREETRDPRGPSEYSPDEIDIIVFPNPTRGDVTVRVNAGRTTTATDCYFITAYDVRGRIAVRRQARCAAPATDTRLSLGSIARGVYFVEAHSTSSGTSSRKIIVRL